MRLDGGHPALDLVNTVYGQVGGPVESDVLATPEDLVTFARRVGLAGERDPRRAAARCARRCALRDALDPLLRAQLAGDAAAAPQAALEVGRPRRARRPGAWHRPRRRPAWTWPDARPP